MKKGKKQKKTCKVEKAEKEIFKNAQKIRIPEKVKKESAERKCTKCTKEQNKKW